MYTSSINIAPFPWTVVSSVLYSVLNPGENWKGPFLKDKLGPALLLVTLICSNNFEVKVLHILRFWIGWNFVFKRLYLKVSKLKLCFFLSVFQLMCGGVMNSGEKYVGVNVQLVIKIHSTLSTNKFFSIQNWLYYMICQSHFSNSFWKLNH